jgi:hypothetical protein
MPHKLSAEFPEYRILEAELLEEFPELKQYLDQMAETKKSQHATHESRNNNNDVKPPSP